MNPHTNEARRKEAEEICLILNERFGYTFCLAIALKELGVHDNAIPKFLNLAKDRKIDSFRDLLKAYGHKSSA